MFKNQKEYVEGEFNYAQLENDFQNIFTNTINKEATANLNINYDDILYCAYDIAEAKGNYNVEAKIPLFKKETDTTKKINDEIWNTFVLKILDIAKNAKVYTTYDMDYVAYVNNNILSLIIKCEYKNGSNPQRKIIQTYNYDVENDELLTLKNIIKYKGINREDLQNKIYEKIRLENSKLQNLNLQSQTYNIFVRDELNQMYDINNTTNFFLGKDNYLFIVYAYGNSSYTSVVDLIIS